MTTVGPSAGTWGSLQLREAEGLRTPEKSFRRTGNQNTFHAIPRRGCVGSTRLEDLPVPQSLANVAIHTVFSTNKDRQPDLAADDIRSEMHIQLGETSMTS